MAKKNLEAIYALSPMQQGMLFHTLLAPHTGVYFQQVSCTLRGEINIAAIRRAWERVVERHEVLRTLFIWEQAEKPLQVIRKEVRLPWHEYDWRHLPPAEQEQKFAAYVKEDREQGFDLGKAPIMRLALIRVEDLAYKLVWSHHHILLDGWSAAMVQKEVFALYEAFCNNQDTQLPTLRPYRDYISWLQKQDLSRAEAYWQDLLKNFSAPTGFGIDRHPRHPDEKEANYDEMSIYLPSEVSARLQALGRKYHFTMSTLLQGAWGLLLSRYSGEQDVVFGATVSGRPADLSGVESMVGLFINTLPVRLSVRREDSLLEWLERIQQQQVESRQYEYSPLVQIQRWTGVPASVPLFESILVFENFPIQSAVDAPKATGRGPKIEGVRGYERTNYPLTIMGGHSLTLWLKVLYDCRRFDAETIKKMLGHFEALLTGISITAQRQVGDLDLFTEEERSRLLFGWNNTSADYPKDACIHELFEEQAARTPDKLAVQFKGERLSYGELNRRANLLASYLRTVGAGPEVRVGICLERSAEMIVGLLAILKTGGAYVPMDPAYPKERLNFMLEDSSAALLVTSDDIGQQLDVRAARVIRIDTERDAIARSIDEQRTGQVVPENAAYVIYTSGSTGTPKGVIGLHRSAINRFAWMWKAYPFDEGEVSCQKTALSFVDSVWEIFGALLQGTPLVIIPDRELKDPYLLVDRLAASGVTRIVLVPSLLRALLETYDRLEERLPRLRTWITSGEELTADLWRLFRESLPHGRLLNLYGSSEVAADVTCFEAGFGLDPPPVIPIGRPVANTQAYILDRFLDPVPAAVPGLLFISGHSLARGYFDRPDATAERFIPNPFSSTPGDRLYNTGDLARYLPDGNIEFLGRLDQQVKVRGFRIEPAEVEAAIVQHPLVRQAAVVARESQGGDRRLVAYVVAEENSIAASELKGFLQQKLPDHMIPSSFVVLEQMPLTPSGKIDRRALPEPDHSQGERKNTYVAPRNSIELQLSHTWEEVLETSPIGVKDNFFELNGHSLLAVRLMGRINQEFGKKIPLATLIQAGTIENLAKIIREQDGGMPWSPLVALQPRGEGRPFFCVHAVGGDVFCYTELARHLGTDRPFYGIQALNLEGDSPILSEIEEMAYSYAEVIRGAQPAGPYLIGGWSMGAIVAFEIAQQLYAQGEQIALLALLDVWTPSFYHQPEEDEATLVATFNHHLGAALNQVRVAEGGADPISFAQRERLFNIYKSNLRAMRHYSPKYYPGRVTLLRTVRSEEAGNDLSMGWDELAGEGVEIDFVPGNHFTMINQPHVQVLAERLRASIDKAEG